MILRTTYFYNHPEAGRIAREDRVIAVEHWDPSDMNYIIAIVLSV